MAFGRKLPSPPKNWFSLLNLASLSLQVIKYEQIYLETAHFTSTGGGFRPKCQHEQASWQVPYVF